MSKGKDLSVINMDATIGIDEVVSIFVTQYEDNLYNKKAELSDTITKLKKDEVEHTKKLKDAVDLTPYNNAYTALEVEFVSTTDDVTVNYNTTTYDITVHIKDCSTDEQVISNRQYRNRDPFIVRYLPMSEQDVEDYDAIVKARITAEEALMQVLTNIKNMSRKERQVRGKISARKVEDAGAGHLLSDPDMVALVQLDS